MIYNEKGLPPGKKLKEYNKKGLRPGKNKKNIKKRIATQKKSRFMNKRRIATIQGNSPSQARLSDDPVDTILVFPLLAAKMETDFFTDLMINLLAL